MSDDTRLEYLRARADRSLRMIERNFGGKKAALPTMRRDALISYITNNVDLIRTASIKQLAELAAILEEVAVGRK